MATQNLQFLGKWNKNRLKIVAFIVDWFVLFQTTRTISYVQGKIEQANFSAVHPLGVTLQYGTLMVISR